MEKELRKSGIHAIGDIPWDTHLCLFYQTREDLFDILIPYFKAGLESEELCLWITSQPLDKDHIQKVMRKCITDFLHRENLSIFPVRNYRTAIPSWHYI